MNWGSRPSGLGGDWRNCVGAKDIEECMHVGPDFLLFRFKKTPTWAP